jgi:hypothetical protein
MADKKISALTPATAPLAGTEVLPIVQSGTTVKVSVDNLTAGKAVSALSMTATNLKTSPVTANLDISGSSVVAAGTDTNIDINITPKGTGEVNLPKIDIDGGAIDGTTIGGAIAAAGTFTTLSSLTSILFQEQSATGVSFAAGPNRKVKKFSTLLAPSTSTSYHIVRLNAVETFRNAYVEVTVVAMGDTGLFRGSQTAKISYGRGSGSVNGVFYLEAINGGNMPVITVWRDTTNNFIDIAFTTGSFGSGTFVISMSHEESSSFFTGLWYGGGATHSSSGLTQIVAESSIPYNGDSRIVNGNLVIGTSGKGIDFSATASGSGTMTSELLNDYEEGTWTPNLGGTATYTEQTGYYTKIGNTVILHCTLVVNSIGTGSTTQVFGVPFSAGAAAGGGGVTYFQDIATAVTSLSPYVSSSLGDRVQFRTLTAAAVTVGNAAIFQNGTRVDFTVIYQA